MILISVDPVSPPLVYRPRDRHRPAPHAAMGRGNPPHRTGPHHAAGHPRARHTARPPMCSCAPPQPRITLLAGAGSLVCRKATARSCFWRGGHGVFFPRSGLLQSRRVCLAFRGRWPFFAACSCPPATSHRITGPRRADETIDCALWCGRPRPWI
jgi:hypothetical protein